jgi:4-oxalocrotonate tautomerase
LPLVRIDISKTASRERVRDVGNAVYNAMIAVANVPQHDRCLFVPGCGARE